MFWIVLGEFEHFHGQVYLQEPEQKWQVVASIKSMPEWTNGECVTLIDVFVFKWSPLINASPEPKLRADVPIGNFFPQMWRAFDFPGITGLDSLEFSFPKVTDSRGVYGALTEFPAKVVLEPDESDWEEGKVKNVKGWLFSECGILHYWQGVVNDMKQINCAADETVQKLVAHFMQNFS